MAVPHKYVCPAPLKLPLPSAQFLLPLEWKILILDGKPFFALDTKNYENNAKNISEINRWEVEAASALTIYSKQKQIEAIKEK